MKVVIRMYSIDRQQYFAVEVKIVILPVGKQLSY